MQQSTAKFTIDGQVVRSYTFIDTGSTVVYGNGSDKSIGQVNGAVYETAISGIETGNTVGIPQTINKNWNKYFYLDGDNDKLLFPQYTLGIGEFIEVGSYLIEAITITRIDRFNSDTIYIGDRPGGGFNPEIELNFSSSKHYIYNSGEITPNNYYKFKLTRLSSSQYEAQLNDLTPIIINESNTIDLKQVGNYENNNRISLFNYLNINGTIYSAENNMNPSAGGIIEGNPQIRLIPENILNPNNDIFGAPINNSILLFNNTQYAWNINEFDEYIDTNYNRSVDRESGFTFTTGVKFINTGNTESIFDNLDDSGNLRGISIYKDSNNNLNLLMRNSSGNSLSVAFTSTTISANTWNIIYLTYDGSSDVSGVTCYINDTEQNKNIITNNLSDTIINNGQTFLIGKRPNNTNYLYGQLMKVEFTNKLLNNNNTKYSKYLALING